MQEKANGNYHEFARQLGIDVAQVHRVLNRASKAGPKFLGRLMQYCLENNLDFHQYIFLDDPLHGCNRTDEQTTPLDPTGTNGQI